MKITDPKVTHSFEAQPASKLGMFEIKVEGEQGWWYTREEAVLLYAQLGEFLNETQA